MTPYTTLGVLLAYRCLVQFTAAVPLAILGSRSSHNQTAHRLSLVRSESMPFRGSLQPYWQSRLT